VDALQGGVALADNRGVLALANLRPEEMFGYQHAELIGCPVEVLVPADLHAAHRRHQARYACAPAARPIGAGARRLADLAWSAVAAKQAYRGQRLLDSVITSLYNVGLSPQAAADLPHDGRPQGHRRGPPAPR